MQKQAIMKWTTVGPTMISCSTDGKMDDATWKAFAKDLESKGITKYIQGVIGMVDVSSLQRKLVVDILTAHKISAVIVTDDRLVRGMITAASWLGANIKGFAWAELKLAVEHIEEVGVTKDRIMAAMQTMRTACERG